MLTPKYVEPGRTRYIEHQVEGITKKNENGQQILTVHFNYIITQDDSKVSASELQVLQNLA